MARSTSRHGSWRRLTTLGATAAVGLVLLGAATTGSAGALTSESPSRPVTTGDVGATPASAPSSHQPRTALERATDLTVTIDSVSPSTLTRGTDLHVSGTVDNSGSERFENAKVYLDVGYDPARSRQTLAEFAANSGGFGNRIVEIGYFDELGTLKPGSTTDYALKIPYGKLPISGEPGIYHIAVTVIAGDEEREPVARADTVIPLLPQGSSGEPVERTGVVTLIPMAAEIRRTANGIFLDDDLASSIAYGGQLRNLLNFVEAAPPNTLEVVLDPALRQAIVDMADGYRVQSIAEYNSNQPGQRGQGEAAAQVFLADLDRAIRRQDLILMAWGSPDASSLGTARMPGVVGSAVRASQRYAADQRITTTVASWPYAGAETRRGLAVAAVSGAPLRIISQRSLVNLRQTEPDGSYPPSQVQVATIAGPTTALVTRTDVAGEVITPDMTAEQLLQDIVSEATVRSLDRDPAAVSVIAVPFGWNPGITIRSKDVAQAYRFPTVAPTTAATAAQEEAVRYNGPIQMPRTVAGLSESVLNSVAELRNKGRVYTELLTDQDRAIRRFDQSLAESGTSLWRNDSVARVIVNDRAARQAGHRSSRVSVTGPTFLALSSESGRFPLTVTNGLPEGVTVQVVVRADNPAVRVDPIDELTLDPGQRRDIEATARTDGSGLTTVRIQLTTTSHRPVGRAWSFDIRSTQIGLAIWIVMGIGGAILFGAAGRRIYARIRSGTMQTREEPQL
jgi:hypothetical protein